MAYATLMAHLGLGRPNAGLLKIAGDLAIRYGARVVGIAACRPIDLAYTEGLYVGDILEQDRQEIEKELAGVEAEFRRALDGRVADLEWRSALTLGLLPDYLTQEARCADLFITAGAAGRSWFDGARQVNPGDLIMQAGRPVLIVPETVDALTFGHAVVCWKDSREARRAVADALPMLKSFGRVTVIEIVPPDEIAAAGARLADVVGWLGRHGVEAASLTPQVARGDVGLLDAIVEAQSADLIVAGAYGHSRMREWVFGGVTRDILLRAGRCALVSH